MPCCLFTHLDFHPGKVICIHSINIQYLHDWETWASSPYISSELRLCTIFNYLHISFRIFQKHFNKYSKPNTKYSPKSAHFSLFLNSVRGATTKAIAQIRNLHVCIDTSLSLYPTLQILINFC